MKGKILVVDDFEDIRELLSTVLSHNGYEVAEAESASALNQAFTKPQPDVVLLDVKLPDADGLDLLPQIKKHWPETEVIVLTGHGTISMAVEAGKRGAYNFLAKPFELAELEARLMALIRRARGSEFPRLACGPLSYDPNTKQFTLSHEGLTLTPREHAALLALIQHSGQPLSKQEVLDRVFSDEQDVHSEAVEVLVHRLRKRLASSPVRISTLRGLGYVLESTT